MVTCDERRRVAAALRAYAETPAPWHLSDVLRDALGEKGDYDRILRLADLIEPPACPSRAVRAYAEEVDWHTGESPLVHELRGLADRMDRECAPVDREALLALAEELEQETGSVCGVCMGKTARRIREACGVVA